MQIEEIFKTVSRVIENSIGVSAGSIQLDDTLFDKLGIDSIDLVDILFELESEYNFPLKVSDLETRVKKEMNGKPYEENGIITADGLEALRNFMTEVNPEKFQPGLTVHQLVQLFTVHSLCKMIQYKMIEVQNEKQQ